VASLREQSGWMFYSSSRYAGDECEGHHVEGFHPNIPVVGQPVAFGIGFLVLILVALTGGVADSLVTMAHEGGHMLTSLMTGRGIMRFELIGKDERVDGLTVPTRINGLGASDIVIGFAGYPTPSLAGLGGAYAVAHGNSWGVLWVGIVLLLPLLLVRSNDLAVALTLIALAGIAWTAIAGGRTAQAAVAVGLVWLMLIGGLRQVIVDNVNAGDAGNLSRWTWIPSLFWFLAWLFISALSLWVGGRILLGY
jgi:Peptidase M50B-like